MPPRIEYQAKTTKELVIMVMDKVNGLGEKLDELNGRVSDNRDSIVKLETINQIEASQKERDYIRANKRLKLWGFIIIPLLVSSGGAVWVVGNIFNWW